MSNYVGTKGLPTLPFCGHDDEGNTKNASTVTSWNKLKGRQHEHQQKQQAQLPQIQTRTLRVRGGVKGGAS